jgi:hypothetical protein
MERSTNGGKTWIPLIINGVAAPYNIGERSIESPVGLNTTYDRLMKRSTYRSVLGESVYCGPMDDPFFVDLGGIFDLGDAPRQMGTAVDGLACMNVSTIALKIPISYLSKTGKFPRGVDAMFDSDYVIGVWASASRQQIRTLTPGGESYEGDWVQVSRIGMPLTNEAVIPVGKKDFWNALSPYDEITDTTLDQYFYNPELALYMDDDLFGGAVPAFSALRIQRNSLQSFDFGNGQDGLFGL